MTHKLNQPITTVEELHDFLRTYANVNVQVDGGRLVLDLSVIMANNAQDFFECNPVMKRTLVDVSVTIPETPGTREDVEVDYNGVPIVSKAGG